MAMEDNRMGGSERRLVQESPEHQMRVIAKEGSSICAWCEHYCWTHGWCKHLSIKCESKATYWAPRCGDQGESDGRKRMQTLTGVLSLVWQ
mmetsp:Transcript_26162/g.77417  ORF Transcript_26162/g.77417 Transcript_26162/m.77417 type:complete len:91 (+) Transcript_26162:5742-6014(+)